MTNFGLNGFCILQKRRIIVSNRLVTLKPLFMIQLQVMSMSYLSHSRMRMFGKRMCECKCECECTGIDLKIAI